MSGRAARLAAWGIGVCGVVAATPGLTSAHGRLVTVARSLMPWAGLAAAPLAGIARLGGRRTVATTGVAVAAATVLACRPLIRPASHTPPDPEAPTLSVVHANLLSVNRRMLEVGQLMTTLAADVVTFSEYTPSHAIILERTGLVRSHPHRIELAAPRSAGTAVWSRYPVTRRPTVPTTHATVVADVHCPHGDVRLVVVHTQSPVAHHGDWLADLRLLGELEPSGPSIMTGDFNASWWHPELRTLLATWRDAHLTLGRGLSASWPTARWNPLFHLLPPFVRLDHALVTADLAVLEIVDLDVPGSDHLGLMVKVAPAAPCRPAPPPTP